MSNYFKFAQVVQSMPPVDDLHCDFDIGVKLGSGPSDGAHYKFILCTDHANWSYLIVKKGLHPELLRWYLLV